MLALTACDTTTREARRMVKRAELLADTELSTIDSLMWRQPDSALTRLLPCFDTCCNDAKFCVSTATEYNRHYANLLLAELLYKNDYAQVNRKELKEAVHYFDSLLLADTRGTDASHASATTPQPHVFFDARAHYINGVGYYETDSVVSACAEYLKALEVMEDNFGEKELVGTKARFMTYTYNRLGDMFSEQFMMEPAILCYKHSYGFSAVSPVSSYSVSSALYRIGKQFNEKGDLDSANYYYTLAVENMPDTTNLYYRDIVSTKAILSYQLTHQAEASIKQLKRMAVLAKDDDERQTRYIIIGSIFFEENLYDSACSYLEPMIENKKNRFVQTRVANYLRIIYDSLGDQEKSNECMRYSALNNEKGAENKALVSTLDDMFKDYINQKQNKIIEEERVVQRKHAIQKTAVILLITLFIVAISILFTIIKHKKSILVKEEHHQKEMELERQSHKIQQAALSGRLKRSNEELRNISKQLEQSLSRNAQIESNTNNNYTAFINTPVCQYIVGLVHERQFKSKMDYLIYKDDALSKDQLLALRDAAEGHLAQFISYIHEQFPKLNDNDMDYCYLFLLGLNEADISALMQRAYTTVCDRSRKISRTIGASDSLYHTLRNMLS